MVIIGGNAVDPFACAEHIIIYSRIVILITRGDTAEITDLHCMHSLIAGIGSIILLGPGRMIISYKKSGFSAALHHIADAFGRVCAYIIRFRFLKTDFISVFYGIGKQIVASVPAYRRKILFLQSNQAHMAAGAAVVCRAGIDLHLIAVQGQKGFVAQFGMRNQNVVVGKGKD